MRRRNPDPVFPQLSEFDAYGRLQATPLMPWGNDGNTCFISSTLQVLVRLEGFCLATRTDSPLGAALIRLRHSLACGNETTLHTAFIALISYARECQWQQRTGGDWGTGDPQVFARHLFERLSDGGADLQREFVVHVIKEYRCSICSYTRAKTKRYPFIAIGQPDTPANLQERIHWYFNNEGGHACTRCGRSMPCTRRLEQGPPHLLVNVKHNDTSDTTPPQMLHCPGPDDYIYQYQLIGAVVYSSGHFTSVILHDSEYWHLGDFDFRRAESIDWQSVNMLFYNKVPPTSLDGMDHRPREEDGRHFQSGREGQEEDRGGGLTGSGTTNKESQGRDQNASPTPERVGGSPMDTTEYQPLERETGQHYEQSESPGLSYPLASRAPLLLPLLLSHDIPPTRVRWCVMGRLVL